MLDDSGALGWGGRAKEPFAQVKVVGRLTSWWVEREGAVRADSKVSVLGNPVVVGDTFQIRTSG